MKFDDYEWHDAILKNLNIASRDPICQDTISVDIEWPDETTSIFVFENVLNVITDLNFGFIAPESIDWAYSTKEDDLNDFNPTNLTDSYVDAATLTCYIIEFSTSGSKIKILARNFIVQNQTIRTKQ